MASPGKTGALLDQTRSDHTKGGDAIEGHRRLRHDDLAASKPDDQR
jgi:hypothetical protein